MLNTQFIKIFKINISEYSHRSLQTFIYRSRSKLIVGKKDKPIVGTRNESKIVAHALSCV